MRISRNLLTAVLAACVLATSPMAPASAAKKKEFNIAWTIYVGWMPWPYAAESGIVKKWADKYGITINVVQINDYVESINQYTAGKFDGVTVTNMDALTIPAAGGVDTTAVIIGDYSNGNDGVVLKQGKTLADIKGQKINLVELSVSHYLLARGLSTASLTEKDIKTVNTSDADIVAASKSPDTTAIVTWNPQLLEVKAEPGATLVFDSSKIPGEIEDLLVLNSETMKDNPELAKALVGIWYETITADEGHGRKGQVRARSNGETLRHGPRGLRDPAQDHAYVLHAKGRCGLHERSGIAEDHGSGPGLLLRAQSARRERQVEGCDRHSDPDSDPWLGDECQAALRSELHDTRSRRKAVIGRQAHAKASLRQEVPCRAP